MTATNSSALLTRSFSGKHLSFRSNFSLGNVSGRITRSTSLSFFGCAHDFNEYEWDLQGCSNHGFDYAIERLRKRQIFLRSYRLKSKEKKAEKIKACFHELKQALFTAASWNCCSRGYERIEKKIKRYRFC
ncbi:hypothetical protein KI387_021771, partial [Taxus chinensis]